MTPYVARLHDASRDPVESHSHAWRGLAQAWKLDARDGYRDLCGRHGGYPLRLMAVEKETVSWLHVFHPAERLELVAASPDDDRIPMPVRGGFGQLWARIRDDDVCRRLHSTRVLQSLAKLIHDPYQLKWDERGIELCVQALLEDGLRPVAEQLLKIARVLDENMRGGPYR